MNSNTVFTENTTVSATVTPSDKAKIDYILNGGENSPLNPDELGEGETAQLSAPTKEAHSSQAGMPIHSLRASL